MESQVTHMGHTPAPLAFRFHVSMLGVFGHHADLLEWTAEERALGAAMMALYKEIRPLVQLGDQYWLGPRRAVPSALWDLLSKNRAVGVLFAFRTQLPNRLNCRRSICRGLSTQTTRYTVEGFPGVRSGQAWMNTGLRLALADLQSTVRRIQRVG